MKINFLTVSLLAGFAGLGGYYAYEQSRPAVTTEGNLLWKIEEGGAPASITFATATESVVYEKQGKEWRYRGRPERPLELRWTTGYSNLMRLVYDRKLSDMADPKAYGLAHPQLTITLDSAHRLLIGAQNPTKSGYYAMVAGQKPLYLLGSWQVDAWRELVSNPPLATPMPTSTSKPQVTNPVATKS